MRTNPTVGEFAQEILKKINEADQAYLVSLETLPELLPFSQMSPIEIKKHPLVCIESQMTLFKLNNMLKNLATSSDPLDKEKAKSIIDEVLTKRFNRLVQRIPSEASNAYFYGTQLPFKANEACIEMAKIAKKWLSDFSDNDGKPTYLHYLIPDLKGEFDAEFKLDGYRLSRIEETNDFTFVKRPNQAPETLSVEDSDTLWHILYGGMVTIEDLIERLYSLVPQNTWQLYLSCYSTVNMLILAMDKPKKKLNEEYTDREFMMIKERIMTFLADPVKYQDDLRLLDTSNQQRLTFEGYAVKLQTMSTPPSLDTLPSDYTAPTLIKYENLFYLYGLSPNAMPKLTLLDGTLASLKTLDFTDDLNQTIFLSPTENPFIYQEIASKQGHHASPLVKPDLEKWMKAAYFTLISLSARVRSLLPEFLGYGGSWTGYSKQQRLEEAQVLLQFLTLDLPLKALPKWLDSNHKEVNARLLSYRSSGRYGKFYKEIIENTNKYLTITEKKTELAAGEKKSRWSMIGWGY